MEKCTQNISEAIRYADQLLALSKKGEEDSADNGCALLYCVVRDCAYKIRAQAEREKASHVAQGRWDDKK